MKHLFMRGSLVVDAKLVCRLTAHVFILYESMPILANSLFLADNAYSQAGPKNSEVARDTHTGLQKSQGDLVIGAGNNLDPGTFWSGMIDDVLIYDRAVTP